MNGRILCYLHGTDGHKTINDDVLQAVITYCSTCSCIFKVQSEQHDWHFTNIWNIIVPNIWGWCYVTGHYYSLCEVGFHQVTSNILRALSVLVVLDSMVYMIPKGAPKGNSFLILFQLGHWSWVPTWLSLASYYNIRDLSYYTYKRCFMVWYRSFWKMWPNFAQWVFVNQNIGSNNWKP